MGMGKIYQYIRFSTNEQDLESQNNIVSNYCKLKGLTIDEVAQDEGISGGVSYKDRNLYSLVCKMQPGDTLIVSEISRIGRSMSDLNKLVNDELKPRKIRLIVVTMGIDLDCSNLKAIDEMILFAFSFSAQIEKEMIQSRTINALESRKKRGISIGGTNDLWGKETKNDRDVVLKMVREQSAIERRERAKKNPENVFFWTFVNQCICGNSTVNFDEITAKLKQLNAKTPTGLEYNKQRCQAMYNKCSKLYDK